MDPWGIEEGLKGAGVLFCSLWKGRKMGLGKRMSCWELVTGLYLQFWEAERGVLEVCCIPCGAGLAFRSGEDLLQEINARGV